MRFSPRTDTEKTSDKIRTTQHVLQEELSEEELREEVLHDDELLLELCFRALLVFFMVACRRSSLGGRLGAEDLTTSKDAPVTGFCCPLLMAKRPVGGKRGGKSAEVLGISNAVPVRNGRGGGTREKDTSC